MASQPDYTDESDNVEQGVCSTLYTAHYTEDPGSRPCCLDNWSDSTLLADNLANSTLLADNPVNSNLLADNPVNSALMADNLANSTLLADNLVNSDLQQDNLATSDLQADNLATTIMRRATLSALYCTPFDHSNHLTRKRAEKLQESSQRPDPVDRYKRLVQYSTEPRSGLNEDQFQPIHQLTYRQPTWVKEQQQQCELHKVIRMETLQPNQPAAPQGELQHGDQSQLSISQEQQQYDRRYPEYCNPATAPGSAASTTDERILHISESGYSVNLVTQSGQRLDPLYRMRHRDLKQTNQFQVHSDV